MVKANVSQEFTPFLIRKDFHITSREKYELCMELKVIEKGVGCEGLEITMVTRNKINSQQTEPDQKLLFMYSDSVRVKKIKSFVCIWLSFHIFEYANYILFCEMERKVGRVQILPITTQVKRQIIKF